jgi:hypothetical protein
MQNQVNGVSVTNDWLPKQLVMDFFHYKATQMAQLDKLGEIKIAKVGRRKFYHRQSILDFLEKKAGGGR